MSDESSPAVLDPASLSPRTDSTYPSEFRAQVEGRSKRVLGDALGLTHYGVNLVELPPGVAFGGTAQDAG